MIPTHYQSLRRFAQVAVFSLALLLCLFFSLLARPAPAPALPEAEMPLYQEIDNQGLGFSYRLPAGWGELSPLLMEIYNSAARSFSGGADAPYLVAAYSSQGSQFIPPVLMLHYLEQPINAGMVEPMNNLFLEEARDEAGKTHMAQKLGLASEVRFIEARELRPGTPLVIAEADSRFGFTVRVMASPFYFEHGLMIVAYFAPLSDFSEHETEMLNFFRSISIKPEALPR